MNINLNFVLGTMLICSQGYAVTNGVLDCNPDDTNSKCHPNVIFSSGFDINGETVIGTRCSGSLIKSNGSFAVFLTAGHCVKDQILNPKYGFGISFDRKIDTYPSNPNLFKWGQFIIGALPLVGNGLDFNDDTLTKNDFGAIILPLSNGTGTRVDGTIVNVDSILPVEIPAVDYTVSLVANGNKVPVTMVGYGRSVTDQEGSNGNANDGVPIDGLGTRKYSDSGLFTGYLFSKEHLKFEQHLNKIEGGVCYGDSGGPAFYVDNGVEYQIGIFSSVNNNTCSNWSSGFRTDIPKTKAFIDCLKAAEIVDDALACGQSSSPQ